MVARRIYNAFTLTPALSCDNSYLVNRLVKIRNLRWETGPVLPDSIRQDTLSTREKEYFMVYNDLLTEYNAMVGVDLTSDLEVCLSTSWIQSATVVSVSLLCLQPPKDLMIEVRAVKDAGKIMTDSGPVSLDKGSIHFLKRYVACCAVCFVLPVQYLTS
jgi:hypothetical protein